MKNPQSLLFAMQTLSKTRKRCYNVGMKNQKKQQNEGFFSSLIGDRTSSKTAGLTYTVAALAMFAVSFVLSCIILGANIPEGENPDWVLYAQYLAVPFSFLFVGYWYFSYTKTPVKQFVKEQKCHWKYYLIAVALQVGLFSLSELNGVFLQFLKRFGYQDVGINLPSMDGVGFIGVFVTIALLPAIMEEFIFRGIFLRDTKDFSLLARVLICGGLFALYHQNPAQTIYQFICGAAFALVAVKSGSFFPTMLAHFINNGVILLLTKLGLDTFTPTVYAITLVVSGLCLVSSLVYLLFFDGKEKKEKKGSYGQLFACAALGILLLFLSWIATFLTGI